VQHRRVHGYDMNGLPFLLPWLRLELLIRTITFTTWDDRTWPIVKVELARALRMRAAVRREGWWN
jgi:hypothetical protein